MNNPKIEQLEKELKIAEINLAIDESSDNDTSESAQRVVFLKAELRKLVIDDTLDDLESNLIN